MQDILDHFRIDAVHVADNTLHIPTESEMIIPLPLKNDADFTLSQLETYVRPNKLGIFTAEIDDIGKAHRNWFY